MNFMAITGCDAVLGTALRMEAYAPHPMVLDMIRKGRSVGKGTACDWCGGAVVSLSIG